MVPAPARPGHAGRAEPGDNAGAGHDRRVAAARGTLDGETDSAGSSAGSASSTASWRALASKYRYPVVSATNGIARA